MEENKNVQTATETTKDDKKKAAKKNDKGDKKKGKFFAEHKAELKKVTWPTKDELVKETVTVIIVSLLVGVIIFCMDTILSTAYNAFDGIGKTSAAQDTDSATDISDLIDIDSDADIDAEIVTGDVEDADAVADEAADSEVVDTDEVDSEAVDTDEAADTDEEVVNDEDADASDAVE